MGAQTAAPLLLGGVCEFPLDHPVFGGFLILFGLLFALGAYRTRKKPAVI